MLKALPIVIFVALIFLGIPVSALRYSEDPASTFVYIRDVTGEIYLNYTKPVNATNATWQIFYSFEEGVSDYIENITLPDDCFAGFSDNQSTIGFLITSTTAGQLAIAYYCWNINEGWNRLVDQVITTSSNSGNYPSDPTPAYDGNWTSGVSCVYNGESSCNWHYISSDAANIMEDGVFWEAPEEEEETPPEGPTEGMPVLSSLITILLLVGIAVTVLRELVFKKPSVKNFILVLISVLVGAFLILFVQGVL